MQGLEPLDDDSAGTVFRDVLLLALLGFVAIVIILLPHLRPPGEAVETVIPPGNVIVEAHWPDGLRADVDLWVQAPADAPVGYSNMGAQVFNLLRDDLGGRNDASGRNYEVTYSRGIPEGEYTVNLHMYSNADNAFPVRVEVAVLTKSGQNKPSKRLLETEVELLGTGQEMTVFRFELTEDGQLVPGSVHDTPRALRASTTEGGNG